MKPLLVQVDDIRESAQPWEAPLSREELDEMLLGDHPTEFHARGPAVARARLTRMGKKVLVQAAFEVPLTGACKRCLKDVALSEEIELTLTYQPAATAREPHHGRKKIEAESPSKKLDERQSSRHDRDEEGSSGSFELALADEETYSGQTIDSGAGHPRAGAARRAALAALQRAVQGPVRGLRPGQERARLRLRRRAPRSPLGGLEGHPAPDPQRKPQANEQGVVQWVSRRSA